MKVQVIKPYITNMSKVANAVKKSTHNGVQIAHRTSEIKGLSKFSRKALQYRTAITHAMEPFIKWASEISESTKTIVETGKTIGKNINKSVARATSKNPKSSKFVAGVRGGYKSLPDVGDALLSVSGINDVKAAKKAAGTIAGVKEAGKSALRVTSSATLAAAGTVVPVPGLSVAGWLVGEKLANSIVGKPYTIKYPKESEKVLKNLSK